MVNTHVASSLAATVTVAVALPRSTTASASSHTKLASSHPETGSSVIEYVPGCTIT